MLLVLGVGAGLFSYARLSTDVFPDLTVPVFNVITQNPSMAPEELELTVTLPVESALNGLPGVRRIRSTTQLGVSQVTVEFESDVDYRLARQFVSERIAQVSGTLPEGARPPYLSSRTNRLNEVYEYLVEGDVDPIINHALGSVQRAILVGAALVVLVLIVLLGDVRSAVIVTITLPLSVVLAGIAMRWADVGINTMTLGGLAIAVGILVDAAIIMTENIHHHLMTGAGERGDVLRRAAAEVGRPIAFATLIIMAVFLPLLLMTGIEGRPYRPLALTVISAMAASLILSLTLVPMLCGWWLEGGPRVDGGAGVDSADSDVAAIRAVKRVYVPALDWAFRHAVLVRVLSLAVTVPAFVGLLQLGTEFMPEFDEGALLVQTVLPAEASLEQVDRVNRQMEEVIAGAPGVTYVSRRSGRSEETEDPMPHFLSDVLVTLAPSGERSGTEAVADDIRERLEDVPGAAALFTTPLGMRIDEGLGGTPAELSIRVFGPDLDVLVETANSSRCLRCRRSTRSWPGSRVSRARSARRDLSAARLARRRRRRSGKGRGAARRDVRESREGVHRTPRQQEAQRPRGRPPADGSPHKKGIGTRPDVPLVTRSGPRKLSEIKGRDVRDLLVADLACTGSDVHRP
jgi:Cu/Ag efflux pump CusA